MVYTSQPSREPTQQAGDKRVFVHRLFTAIAPRYDWFNRLASVGLDQRWRKQAVAASQLVNGMTVLDVCSGTGDLAFLCAAQTDGNSFVLGLDFTQPMLKEARRKQNGSPHTLRWLQADAQSLPFVSARFDRVFMGFSTRNLSDLNLGIREMLRVLKPGGRLLILETGRPRNRLVRAGHLLFLATAARFIGWCLTGKVWPFSYLARSVKQFLSPEEVVARLRQAGAEARYLPLSWGLASLFIATKPT